MVDDDEFVGGPLKPISFDMGLWDSVKVGFGLGVGGMVGVLVVSMLAGGMMALLGLAW